MENTFEQLAHMLTRKLDLYLNLKQLLEDEKNHIIAMDLDCLWESTNQKKQLSADILVMAEAMKAQMSDSVQEKMSDGEGRINIHKRISALPIPSENKAQLRNIACKIDDCRHEVIVKAEDNKKYLTQYLSVINDVFATVSSVAKEKQYSNSGRVFPAEGRLSFIRTEV